MILKQVIKYTNAVAIEATWENDIGVVTRSTAYAGNQMDLFQSDIAKYGGNIEDYLELMAEVEAEFVSEPPQPTTVPSSVSMRQARLALLQFGILATVNNAIAAGTEADKITWEYATEVNRNDALVQNLSVSLGLTEQDLDNLFLLASSL